MTHYYNEFDPNAAAWLSMLMACDLIPYGHIDTRSIIEVHAADLRGFTQCHFFAGIAGWPLALRMSGWPESEPIWTGSCPCPPFSVAGKRKPYPECGCLRLLPHPYRTGVFACRDCGHQWAADERHLWPEFHRLIAECRPTIVVGEQVSGNDGRLWLAGVRATLEILGYGVGACDLCSAGVGAPNIRQRLFWLGDSTGDIERRDTVSGTYGERGATGGSGGAVRLVQPNGSGPLARQPASTPAGHGDSVIPTGGAGGLGDTNITGPQGRPVGGATPNQRTAGPPGLGIWSDYDTIPFINGETRRAEPGVKPMVAGLPKGMGRVRNLGVAFDEQETAEARVMRLKGYGNALNCELAAAFMRAVMAPR